MQIIICYACSVPGPSGPASFSVLVSRTVMVTCLPGVGDLCAELKNRGYRNSFKSISFAALYSPIRYGIDVRIVQLIQQTIHSGSLLNRCITVVGIVLGYGRAIINWHIDI